MEVPKRIQPNSLILILAIVLGVIGSLFLRDVPWGLNATVWALLISISLIVFGKNRLPGLIWYSAILILIAFCISWRDSAVLKVINVSAFIYCVGIVLIGMTRGSIKSFSIADSILGVPLTWLYNIIDFPELLNSFKKATTKTEPGQPPPLPKVNENENILNKPLIRGVAVALPLLLLFGALFASADDAFRSTFSLNIDFEETINYIAVFIICTWAAGGIFWRSAFAKPVAEIEGVAPPSKWFGFTELAIVLGSLIAMFSFFVWLQIRYLFGGTELVQTTLGLSFAEYARKGFFELLVVAALVMPLLLLVNWVIPIERIRDRKWVVALSAILIGLLFIIMASAMMRLYIYVEEFGLTESRFYAAMSMIWLALAFIAMMATVLRGKTGFFALSASLAILLVVIGMNISNPDALIAQTNINRAYDGKDIDVNYITTLSADAYPVLLQTSDPIRKRIEVWLRQQAWEMKPYSWTTWNYGHHIAFIEAEKFRISAPAETPKSPAITN